MYDMYIQISIHMYTFVHVLATYNIYHTAIPRVFVYWII